MGATTTLENVIEQVHQRSAGHYDEIVPVREMAFDSIERMWVSGKQVEVMPSAQRLLANRLRVPHSYLARCPAHLQAENLNYWVWQEGTKRDTFFCRFDGDRLRAVFTERYTVLDHLEILSSMLDNGFQPSQEVQYRLDDNLLVVKVPEYEQSFEVSANDRMVPGISFSNSEVGMLAFCVEVSFYRLVCCNGLIAKVTAGASRFKPPVRHRKTRGGAGGGGLDRRAWRHDVFRHQRIHPGRTGTQFDCRRGLPVGKDSRADSVAGRPLTAKALRLMNQDVGPLLKGGER